MSSGGNFLDALLTGYKTIQGNGVPFPAETTINFINATVADNPGSSRTDVTISATVSVTGTGFLHNTAGVLDAAARAVDLSTADVTGVMALTHIAQSGAALNNVIEWNGSQWVSGNGSGVPLAGEVTGSLGASVVSGPFSTGAMQWTTSATSVGWSQAAPVGATAAGQNMTFAPQAGGATSGIPGSFIVNVAAPNGGSTEAGLVVERGGTQIARIAQHPAASQWGLWLGSSNNQGAAALYGTGTLTYVNATAQVALLLNDSTFALWATTSGIQLFSSTPSLGSGTSVLGVTNATAAPTTNPTGGGILYASGGALLWRGSSGTVTTIAVA